MRYLAGDIGGTKTLLVLYDESKGKLSEEKREKYVSQHFDSLEAIVEKFLGGVEEKIDRACFGIAGPVKNQKAQTTNLPWLVDAKKLQKKFGFEKCHLINDLEANAYGIKVLKSKDFLSLNAGTFDKQGNQALISAGTGLGEAPIFNIKGDLIPSASEGGHADFAPTNRLQIELLEYLMGKFGHVSVERVLSGQGLVNIFEFFVAGKKEKVSGETREEMRKDDPAKVITKRAEKKECPVCKKSLDLFCEIYGQEAGNFALKTMATGGIYLGGGIAAKISKQLKKGSFIYSFINKGRFTDFLKEVPVHIILDQDTALKGSVFYAKNCE